MYFYLGLLTLPLPAPLLNIKFANHWMKVILAKRDNKLLVAITGHPNENYSNSKKESRRNW